MYVGKSCNEGAQHRETNPLSKLELDAPVGAAAVGAPTP